jgi:hypothetical protein
MIAIIGPGAASLDRLLARKLGWSIDAHRA